MAYSKPLVLETTETGCIVPTSHKLNGDGYFRKRVTASDGRRAVLTMYHRHVWEKAFGPIQDGYEVDHKCKNRACCNLEHLQLLEGSEHAILSNVERYAERTEAAKRFIRDNPGVSGTKVGEIFGVSFSLGCRWRREVAAEL